MDRIVQKFYNLPTPDLPKFSISFLVPDLLVRDEVLNDLF